MVKHNAIYVYFTYEQCHDNNESFDDEVEWNSFVENYQDEFAGTMGDNLDDFIGYWLGEHE